MESTAILEFPPDLIQTVRKAYDLEQPGRMEESINILKEWIQKQAHFNEKEFSTKFLERSIITYKGSVERAKTKIDKSCTFRTLLPHYFDVCDANKLHEIYVCGYMICLPKLDQDLYRAVIIKPKNLKTVDFADIYKYSFMLYEYTFLHDYALGYCIVLDYTSVDLSAVLKKINVIELHQYLTIFFEGYAVRVKGIHIVTTSKLVEVLISLMNQTLSPKLMSRIFVHKTSDALKEHIPEDILPIEYGGKERPIEKLHEEWYRALTSKEHIAHMEKMKKFSTNEAYRPKDQFNEQYMGLAGTFRTLTVD